MSSFTPRCLAALAGSAVLALGASAAQARAHAPLHVPNHKRTATTSTNWSGYAVNGSNATDVIGSWTQPKVQTCAASENTWSSPWVGIDGDVSNTVEQIGTDSDCYYGTPRYYAWYEMYPKSLVTIKMTINPYDRLTAEVKYVSGGFQMTLIDTTTGQTFTTTQPGRRVARSSVEWIMEGPTGSGLTNFGSTPFGSVPTRAGSATIGGQTEPLSSFSNPEVITMTTTSGVVRAQPSGLDSNSAFGVTWQHS